MLRRLLVWVGVILLVFWLVRDPSGFSDTVAGLLAAVWGLVESLLGEVVS